MYRAVIDLYFSTSGIDPRESMLHPILIISVLEKVARIQLDAVLDKMEIQFLDYDFGKRGSSKSRPLLKVLPRMSATAFLPSLCTMNCDASVE